MDKKSNPLITLVKKSVGLPTGSGSCCGGPALSQSEPAPLPAEKTESCCETTPAADEKSGGCCG